MSCGAAGQQGSSAGFAYVFRRAGGVWTQRARVRPATIETGDQFGRAIAVSGTAFVATAPRDASSSTGVGGDPTNNGTSRSGAAYVFSL